MREGLQEMPTLPDLSNDDPIDSQLWPRVVS
jgi:hypothetical protein